MVPLPTLTVLPLVAALALSQGPQDLSSIEEEAKRPTLRGLPGVFLVVNTPTHLVTSAERTNIVTEAELTLRSAGIRLYTVDDVRANPRLPTLLIASSATRVSRRGDPVPWATAVELSQGVYLARDPNLYTRAITWNVAGWFGFGPEESILEKARTEIINGAKRFANAYSAANAK